MKEYGRKGHSVRRGKRWLALFICMCLIGTMIPVTARAENSSPDTGLCEHHKEHTEECGYEAPIEGHECEHEHTEDCYVPGECQHQHTEDCYTDGVLPEEGEAKEADQCEHECTVESGCLVLNCPHENGEHDDTCGYVEASEGSPCTYECEICGNEAERRKTIYQMRSWMCRQ